MSTTTTPAEPLPAHVTGSATVPPAWAHECLRCKHLKRTSRGRFWRCKALVILKNPRGGGRIGWCADARKPGGVCGEEGKAFVAVDVANNGMPPAIIRKSSRVSLALAFIDKVRMASHIDVGDYLKVAPWRASIVCNYLYRRGLIALVQRGKRGRVSHPTIWHTKTNKDSAT